MDPTLAEIKLFGGNFAPTSWAFCNGQLMAIAEYTALFALIGTTYGGDGQETFALPDLRGRVAVGTGQGNGLSNVELGQVWGSESITLTTGNMPAHSHTGNLELRVNASTNTGNNTGANSYWAASTSKPYDSAAGNVSMAPNAVQLMALSNNTGNGQSINNMQPYLALNYLIAIEGVFPSRN